MDKLDVKKTEKALYSGRNHVWEQITVPPLSYLAREGQGDPASSAYAQAIAALYPLAYKIKFLCKAKGADFVVPPLEAQWWADNPEDFVTGRRSEWRWRVLIRIPVSLDDTLLSEAREKAGSETDAVALTVIEEGLCYQTLHIGPYSEEAPVLAELHEEVMPAAGMTFGLPHHEIYLSDPRRVAPEKLRTILRQPVVPI